MPFDAAAAQRYAGEQRAVVPAETSASPSPALSSERYRHGRIRLAAEYRCRDRRAYRPDLVCRHDGNALDIGKSLLLEGVTLRPPACPGPAASLAVFLRSQAHPPLYSSGALSPPIASTMILILKLSLLGGFDLLERPLGDFWCSSPACPWFIAERLDNAEVYVHRRWNFETVWSEILGRQCAGGGQAVEVSASVCRVRPSPLQHRPPSRMQWTPHSPPRRVIWPAKTDARSGFERVPSSRARRIQGTVLRCMTP